MTTGEIRIALRSGASFRPRFRGSIHRIIGAGRLQERMTAGEIRIDLRFGVSFRPRFRGSIHRIDGAEDRKQLAAGEICIALLLPTVTRASRRG
jgi:hypothetical protein